MNRNTFFVIEEQEIESGRYVAYAEKVPNCYNLLHYFKPRRGMEIISVNACNTWKEAVEIARCWNEGWRKSGKYLYQRNAA